MIIDKDGNIQVSQETIEKVDKLYKKAIEKEARTTEKSPRIQLPSTEDNARRELMSKQTYQSNIIIENRKSWTNREAKLFYLALAEITPKLKDDFTDYTKELAFSWTPQQVVRAFGHSNNIRNVMKDICSSLSSKATFFIEHGEDSWEIIHLFSYIVWSNKRGLVMVFDKRMNKYLVDLVNKHYTKIQLSTIFALTSAYAIRILELMMKVINLKKKTQQFTYDGLREKLGIPEKKYKRFNNFKSRILDLPINEINTNTDFMVSCEITRIMGTHIITLSISRKKVEIGKISYDSSKEKEIRNVMESLTKLNEMELSNQEKGKLLEQYVKTKGAEIVKMAQDRLKASEPKKRKPRKAKSTDTPPEEAIPLEFEEEKL